MTTDVPSAVSGDGRAHSRILLLAHRPLSERSFGGGQRTAHIRDAAAGCATVDTLVLLSGQAYRGSSAWDEQRVRTLAFRTDLRRPQALIDLLRVRRDVSRLLAEGSYDLVIARYLSTSLMVSRRHRDRLVLDADDIVKSSGVDEAGGSAATRVRSALRRALVRRILSAAAHVWFVNPADLSALGPMTRRASLLPNAALHHRTRRDHPDSSTLLIVGHYGHAPNREAVDFLIADVLPALRLARPDLDLRIVGSVPPDAAREWGGAPNVEVLGFVEDLGSEYSRASLALVPVRTGGGTQIKLIEALANSCPTVASRFAARGYAEALQPHRHLFVADSAQEWIGTCLEALQDPQRAQSMADEAAGVVAEAYGVAALQARVRQTLVPLLSGARSRRAASRPNDASTARAR